MSAGVRPARRATGMPAALRRRPVRVALACLLHLVLVAVAVAPQLSARLTGSEYLVRVAPVDPIDPARGAYVALRYPDLGLPFPAAGPRPMLGDDGRPLGPDEDPGGDVYVPLVRAGGVWRAGTATTTRPDGPALRCRGDRYMLSCGIDSYFLPQARAAAAERAVSGGTALARLRVDGAGHAAVVALESPDGPL